MNDRPSTLLIYVLRSTSYLLELYRYSGRHPTLSELQHMIGRAIANLEDAAISENTRPSTIFESLENTST